jgi:hypothetical protein
MAGPEEYMEKRNLRRLLWSVLGLSLGLVIGYFWLREPSAPLTFDRLDEARRRWQEAGPASYVLEVETSGAVAAVHRIVVVEGEVVEMTTGGRVATPSAWEYWSVEGLFDFLVTELRNADNPQQAYGTGAAEVVLQARFDPDLGFPSYFLRHVLGRQQSIEWNVIRFEAGS